MLRGWANYHRPHRGQKHICLCRLSDLSGHRPMATAISPSQIMEMDPQQILPATYTIEWGYFHSQNKKPKSARNKPGRYRVTPSETKYVRLYKVASTKIVRRVKVRMTANPFDPSRRVILRCVKSQKESGKMQKAGSRAVVIDHHSRHSDNRFANCRAGLYRPRLRSCLSSMFGNKLVGFLGGNGAARPLPYPSP